MSAQTAPAGYLAYYNRMSYRDFLAREAAGTLDDGTISMREGEEVAA